MEMLGKTTILQEGLTKEKMRILVKKDKIEEKDHPAAEVEVKEETKITVLVHQVDLERILFQKISQALFQILHPNQDLILLHQETKKVKNKESRINIIQKIKDRTKKAEKIIKNIEIKREINIIVLLVLNLDLQVEVNTNRKEFKNSAKDKTPQERILIVITTEVKDRVTISMEIETLEIEIQTIIKAKEVATKNLHMKIEIRIKKKSVNAIEQNLALRSYLPKEVEQSTLRQNQIEVVDKLLIFRTLF